MASRASLEYDYLFKIVLVGDAAVGKTNLLACYTSQVGGWCISADANPSLAFTLSWSVKSTTCPVLCPVLLLYMFRCGGS